MKSNMECGNDFTGPFSGVRSGCRRDAVLGIAANLVIRDGFMDIGLSGLLERLSFERLSANRQVSVDELASFYHTPEMLLDALFDVMLSCLEARISSVAANDTESLGRFERAYRAVIVGRADPAPLVVSGLDGALMNRLFFLFMSAMDHDSKNGTGFTLQQRWMSWYNKQIVRYDEPKAGVTVA